MKPDPNKLPNGSLSNLIVILITASMASFWIGQYLPTPEYFRYFLDSTKPPLFSTTYNCVYGLSVFSILSLFLYAVHPIRQARAYGAHKTLDRNHPIRISIEKIAKIAGVKVNFILLDYDTSNCDAIAFGYSPFRSILLGRGLLVLFTKRPDLFFSRIAHELGHFKNNDVSFAFAARSVVAANIILIISVCIWELIIPIKSLTNIYGPPAMSGDAKLYFYYHWQVILETYLNNIFVNLVVTMPACLFWYFLLFAEYRSLLRKRELLADAHAARLYERKAIISSLGGVNGPVVPDRRAELLWFMRAHPSIHRRISSINDPSIAASPSNLRFFTVGYLYAVVSFFGANTISVVGTLSNGFGQILAAKDVDAFIGELTRNWDGITIMILAGIFNLILLTLLLSLILRLAIQLHFSSSNFSLPQRYAKIVVSGLYIYFGVVVGFVVRPYSFYSQNELFNAVYRHEDILSLIRKMFFVDQSPPMLFVYFTIFVILSYISLILICCEIICRSSIRKRIFYIEWLLMIIISVLIANEMNGTILLFLLRPDVLNVSYFRYHSMLTGVLLFLLAMLMAIMTKAAVRGNRRKFDVRSWIFSREYADAESAEGSSFAPDRVETGSA